MTADEAHALVRADGYHALIQSINERFNALTGPVFETDATGLYALFLDSFSDPDERRLRTCNCCRRFIERFGALATVSDSGTLVSAIWDADAAPAHYRETVAALCRRVSQASISMLFLSSEPIYGKPLTGPWRHFAIKPDRVFRSTGLHNAYQTACARREAFRSVRRVLGEYTGPVCAMALRLLGAQALANSEAALGQAQFLVDLHAARDAVGARQHKDNLVYRMVATAPMGFCHPRSGMIATLLDDIVAGKTFEQAAANWAAKMHPLQYQRPQAAPSAGAIKAAELAFEALGAASALERRYATMADMQEFVWQPRAPAGPPSAGAIFAGVTPKPAKPGAVAMTQPALRMTLDKFRRTVLPTADKIEMAAPAGKAPFIVFTSAVHADARPIYQWDTEAHRNPVAWYLYVSGSFPCEFNLSGSFYAVTAIVEPPYAWAGQRHPQHGERLVFLLKDARDLYQRRGGSALYPACLKGELREFRKTIEAYSRANNLAGHGEDNVAGLVLHKGGEHQVDLRVTAGGQVSAYRLDRWD